MNDFPDTAEYILKSWDLTETREELTELCKERDIDFTHTIEVKSDKRAREMLAELLLIHEFSDGKATLSHTADGAPRLAGLDCHISITHSRDIVCVAFSRHCPIGIDIEFDSAKIIRVRHKFLNSEEMKMFPEDDSLLNHLAWCAKEAIYKAASTKGIDLREDIRLNKNISKGTFHHNGTITNYLLTHPAGDRFSCTLAIPE